MGTYQNAYDILKNVREGLNESSTALLQGTDTSGKFSNNFLLDKINRAQRVIYARVFTRLPEIFQTDTDVTVSNGVITLPWDYGMIRRLEDEDDLKVFPVDLDKKPVLGQSGSDRLYRRQGNTLVLNDTSINTTYHLWYYKKPRDLDTGKAPSADTLATSAKAIEDYYNNMTIEDITDDQSATITDYTSARVITSGITLAQNSYYGIVSDLPEMLHHLIAPLAVIMAKAMHPVSPEKPTRMEVDLFRTEFADALNAFGHKEGDMDIESLFTDFGAGEPMTGINIPGQGYIIY